MGVFQQYLKLVLTLNHHRFWCFSVVTLINHQLTHFSALLCLLLLELTEVSLSSDLLEAKFRSFTNKLIHQVRRHGLNVGALTGANRLRGLRARDSVEERRQVKMKFMFLM